ncbi:MAG: AMP-binding protein [Bacteroidota bacterium]
MKHFLPKEAIHLLWQEKLMQLAPRLEIHASDAHRWLKGDLKDDLGLDSLEVFELAAYFHSVFHLMSGPISQYLLQYRRAEEWLDAIEEGANDWNRPMTFFTSGSTGTPKGCNHDKKYLMQEIEAWNHLLQPKGTFWRAVSPLHMYGFIFSVLLPYHIGSGVLDIRRVHIKQIHSLAKETDWVIGFPLFFQSWIRAGVQFPQKLHAISSTAPLPPILDHQMTDSGLKVMEIYGSSETGGVGYRVSPEKDFCLLPHWVRAEGEIVRYHPQRKPLYYPLSDQVAWEDRRFTVLGRKDHAVQVGGINVFPDQIARQIEKLEGVGKCWVRKMRSGEGERLKCWIVPEPSQTQASVLKKTCYQWIENHLPVAERPRHIIVSTQPPLDAMGKSRDWSIFQIPTL